MKRAASVARPWPVLAGLLCLVLAACGDGEAPAPAGPSEAEADFGAAPQAVALTGAPALVTPPAGRWLVSDDTPVPGQWYEQYRRPEYDARVQVLVFPTREARAPVTVLPSAIDVFVRSLGTDGFGQPERGHGNVWGVPAAWATFVASIEGVSMRGRGRLLLAAPDTWAFAVGCAPATAPQGVHDAIQRAVDSLEPAAPQFWQHTFRSSVDPAQVVAQPAGEEPVRRRDIMAVQLVLEAGVGTRFPLASRAVFEAALADEARHGTAAGRASFRATTKLLADTATMEPAEREAGLRALGAKILKAILDRLPAGHAPALTYYNMLKQLRTPAAGGEQDHATVGALQSLHEMSAFLATLAADRVVPVDKERARAMTDALKAGWDDMPAAERDAVRAAGRTWAALRYAWDHATPAARDTLRAAALAALVPAAERAAVAALGDARARMAWMHAHAEAEADGYARRAAALPIARFAELSALLEVDAAGHHLGW